LDPGGPKTYGSGGSGSTILVPTEKLEQILMNDLVLLEPDDNVLVALFAGEVSPPLRVQEQLVLLALQPQRLAQPRRVQRCRVQVQQALQNQHGWRRVASRLPDP
jgi:hypothetical protein